MPTLIRAIVALILLILLLLCWAGIFGGMRHTMPTLALSGGAVAGQPFTLSGTASPNANLGIFANGTQIGSATAGADGKWSYPANFAQAGTQQLEVRDTAMSGMGASASLEVAAGVSGVGFSSPTENEVLDAQDFILEGTGTPNSSLELTRDGVSLGTVTVGSDGKWSYPVSGDGVKPGEYTYSVAGVSRKVIVKAGQSTASNARCPCKLRLSSFTNGRVPTPGAAVILFKDGAEVARGAAPFLFTGLAEGEYTYTVQATGYRSEQNRTARVPKNKNIQVYLAKQP